MNFAKKFLKENGIKCCHEDGESIKGFTAASETDFSKVFQKSFFEDLKKSC